MTTEEYKRESVRSTCVLHIQNAIKYANEHNFKVVVASDPEGNGYHDLNYKNMEYDPKYTKDNVIALGVWGRVDKKNIFKN